MINQEVLDIDRIKECFETFFDAILIIDNNLKGFYFNQNFANLFNVESGTILAVPVEQIFDQLKICHEIPLLSQVLLKASPCEGGRYIAPESNSEVQWTYSPIIVDEQVQGIICTAKRYAATESLSNSSIQRLLPNVTQYLPGIIYEYIFDPEEGGRFIYISPQVSQLFGINAAAVLKDSGLLEKTIHEEDIKSFNETNEHCNREGLEWQWEGRIRVGKKVKWIEAKSSAIKQPNEKLLRYGIILDITERKLIEQRLELALKGADLGLWDYSFETKDVFISERWAKLLGYTQQEIEENHRNWMNFVHPEDACMVKELVIAHLKGQTEFYESVYRFKTKSGEWRWIMERGQVVARDIKGRALRWVGTVQDFHYRKLSEKVLADS
ncbi:MAG TPA: PAS domain-containing protein, partial [Cyclobacteriaceae bacterium]|nr:PAS domain-containing protein [Cyclobacteriaceae bacterium]